VSSRTIVTKSSIGISHWQAFSQPLVDFYLVDLIDGLVRRDAFGCSGMHGDVGCKVQLVAA
jgi:hypothetical protein